MIRLSSPLSSGLRVILVLGLAAAALTTPVVAQPVFKDRERFDENGRVLRNSRLPSGREIVPRPATRTTPGPGYVGSSWGLGKPSYWGIGPRPDWGYSGD